MKGQTKDLLIALLLSMAMVVQFANAIANTTESNIELNGSLFFRNYESEPARALQGYPVYLYNENGDAKAIPSPSVTDSYGRYAFQSVPKGKYIIRIVSPKDTAQTLWQEDVEITQSLQLEPVVIPTLFPVSAHASYKVCSDEQGECRGACNKAKKGCYFFRGWIDVPTNRKSEIQSVEYTFDHPTFTRKTYVGRGTDFSAGYAGWGCLTSVTVKVFLKTGAPIFIDFDMCRTLHDW